MTSAVALATWSLVSVCVVVAGCADDAAMGGGEGGTGHEAGADPDGNGTDGEDGSGGNGSGGQGGGPDGGVGPEATALIETVCGHVVDCCGYYPTVGSYEDCVDTFTTGYSNAAPGLTFNTECAATLKAEIDDMPMCSEDVFAIYIGAHCDACSLWVGTLEPGDNCLANDNGCGPDDVCTLLEEDGQTVYRCVARCGTPEGQPCSEIPLLGLQCEPGTACFEGQCRRLGQQGEFCDGVLDCADPWVCDYGDNTCVARSAVGSECGEQCDFGAACDYSDGFPGVCVPAPDVGDPCGDDLQCLPGEARCRDGICEPALCG